MPWVSRPPWRRDRGCLKPQTGLSDAPQPASDPPGTSGGDLGRAHTALQPGPFRGPPPLPPLGPCLPHPRCHWPQVHPVPIQSLYDLGPYLGLPARPASLAPNTAGPILAHPVHAPTTFLPAVLPHPDRSSHTLPRPLPLPGPRPSPPPYLCRTLSPPGHFPCPGLLSPIPGAIPSLRPLAGPPAPGLPSPGPHPHPRTPPRTPAPPGPQAPLAPPAPSPGPAPRPRPASPARPAAPSPEARTAPHLLGLGLGGRGALLAQHRHRVPVALGHGGQAGPAVRPAAPRQLLETRRRDVPSSLGRFRRRPPARPRLPIGRRSGGAGTSRGSGPIRARLVQASAGRRATWGGRRQGRARRGRTRGAGGGAGQPAVGQGPSEAGEWGGALGGGARGGGGPGTPGGGVR